MENRSYLIIDLKSFYASSECVMHGLDPMTTDLVVADAARGRGTICLAVSPSLKAKGVRNRCRVFEIPARFRYIMATPRMQLYLNYAAEIFLPPASGTVRLDTTTNASSVITDALKTLYVRIVRTGHPIRRILLCANHVEPEARQELSLFAPPEAGTKERARQQTTLALHQRFGKNVLLRATDLLAAATRRERNEQIGGHKAYGNQETVEPRKNLPALRRPARAAGAPA